MKSKNLGGHPVHAFVAEHEMPAPRDLKHQEGSATEVADPSPRLQTPFGR